MITEGELGYYKQLDERMQRLLLGMKAKQLGRSGVRLVSEAFCVDPETIRKDKERAWISS